MTSERKKEGVVSIRYQEMTDGSKEVVWAAVRSRVRELERRIHVLSVTIYKI
jgi:hypothetical protein